MDRCSRANEDSQEEENQKGYNLWSRTHLGGWHKNPYLDKDTGGVEQGTNHEEREDEAQGGQERIELVRWVRELLQQAKQQWAANGCGSKDKIEK